MESDEGWTNPMLAMVLEVSRKKKTRALRAALAAELEGHDIETVLAAVVPLLVEVHLDAHADEDNVVCATCANADLTELLQTVRRISEDVLGDADDDGDHG